MTLRPAAEIDEAMLFLMHRTAFQHHIEKIWGWNEEWQKANFRKELTASATFVILDHRDAVGYLQYCDEGSRIYIQNIALLPGSQRRGIGTRLIHQLQEMAALRCVPLELGVFRTNEPALMLYERLGFKKQRDTATHSEMLWCA